tara:strand:- start:4453 stop:4671 length:219 start_codon:yes stop_codon:yes gene_type:complete
MKVKTFYKCEDYRESCRIEVNGKNRITVGTPEPEDATLSRDLNFVYDIVPLMKEAWDAGKRGEEFIFVHEEK